MSCCVFRLAARFSIFLFILKRFIDSLYTTCVLAQYLTSIHIRLQIKLPENMFDTWDADKSPGDRSSMDKSPKKKPKEKKALKTQVKLGQLFLLVVLSLGLLSMGLLFVGLLTVGLSSGILDTCIKQLLVTQLLRAHERFQTNLLQKETSLLKMFCSSSHTSIQKNEYNKGD